MSRSPPAAEALAWRPRVREAVASSVCNVVLFAVWVGVPTIAPEAGEA